MLRAKLRKIKRLKNSYRFVKKTIESVSDILVSNYCKLTGKPILYSYYARVTNFGDLFNKDLISYFNMKLIFTSDYKKSQASLLGSILQMYPSDYKGYVLGSGFIDKRFKRLNNKWKVLLIRGPLSAKQCEAKDCVYGDPGILASLIYKNKTAKKYKLGILPHSSDYDKIKTIDFGEGVKIITARKSPSEVANDIVECKNIASSSLHGLIFADSFGIPNVHLKFGDKLIGGLHKFDDYYLGMDVENPPKPIIFNKSLSSKEILSSCKLLFNEELIAKKQQDIIDVYKKVLLKITND